MMKVNNLYASFLGGLAVGRWAPSHELRIFEVDGLTGEVPVIDVSESVGTC